MRRNVRWCSCWVVGVAASHDTVRDAAGDDDDGRSAAGGDDAGGAEGGGGGDAGRRRRGDEAQEATNPPTKRLSALTRALSAELLPHSSLSLLHRSLLNRYPTSRMNESGHQIMKLSVPSKGGFIEACYCAVCRAGPQMADTASVRHRAYLAGAARWLQQRTPLGAELHEWRRHVSPRGVFLQTWRWCVERRTRPSVGAMSITRWDGGEEWRHEPSNRLSRE